MNKAYSIQVIHLADLVDESYRKGFDDPEKIANITPQKIAALQSNPFSHSPDDPVCLLGLSGRRVIGRLDLFLGEFLVDGISVPAIWGSYLFVSPEQRKGGMGLSLILKMQSLAQAVGVCGVSQMVYPIYKNLRWLDFTMPRFILIRRSRSVVNRYCGYGVHSTILAAGVDAVLWTQRRALRLLARTGIKARSIASAPTEWDKYLRPSARVAPQRSAAWINWAIQNGLSDDPLAKQGLFEVSDGSGRALGYFLIKQRFHSTASQQGFKDLLLCSLQDWAAFEPGRIATTDFVFQAMLVLEQWGGDALEVCLPNSADGGRLRKYGFFSAGQLHLLVKPARGSILSKEEFHDHTNWRIAPADGDNFLS